MEKWPEKLSKRIYQLNKDLEETKKNYELKLRQKDEEIKEKERNFNNKLKEKEKEINLIKKDISEIKEQYENKIINKEAPLICKINPYSIDKCLTLKDKIDTNIGTNDIFEVYHLHNDENAVYIASKNKSEKGDKSYILILQILSLEEIYPIAKLYGHNKDILFIKYYLDNKYRKDYLLSGDKEYYIIIWNIIDCTKYQKVSVLSNIYGKTLLVNPFENNIYNCLFIFNEKKNYIYITIDDKNYGRLYELEDGSFIKDVKITYYYQSLYLIKYKNSEYQNLIIDCCKDYIVIYNPFNEEIYSKIETKKTEGDNRHACIIYNRDNSDFLYIINENGYIIRYDLNKKIIDKSFNLKGEMHNVFDWNNYLIYSQYDEDYLGIIHISNLSDGSIEKKIKCKKKIVCIKNITLNQKEELIIAAGKNSGNIFIFFSSLTSKVPQIPQIETKQ